MDLHTLLERSSSRHDHLCPRQILGVRIGMAGMKALGFSEPPKKKQLLVISETDGCFVDGVIAATGCTVGHRTLRVEDYGKVAATFVDTKTGRSIRVAPMVDVRKRAYQYAPHEPRHYFAQMQAYQIMPDEEMFTITKVQLAVPVEKIVSHPGVRVNCDACGEEIMNEREVHLDRITLCRACAGGEYYQSVLKYDLTIKFLPISAQIQQGVLAEQVTQGKVEVEALPLIVEGGQFGGNKATALADKFGEEGNVRGLSISTLSRISTWWQDTPFRLSS
jgi:formylmethanofuran dehydrogenase subunit E